MAYDPIEQLLQQADRAAGGPPSTGGNLAGRVRALAGRRERARVLTASFAAGLLLAALGTWAVRGLLRPDDTTAGGASPASLQLARIVEEADRLRRELSALPVLPADAPELPAADPANPRLTSEVDLQLERTAFLTVYQGDRYYRELDMLEPAMTSYREAIRLFPQTRAARAAEARLAALAKEESL